MEGQGRRKVLRVLEQSFGDLPAGTFSFPRHERAFCKGISTPGTPHQKHPLHNVLRCPTWMMLVCSCIFALSISPCSPEVVFQAKWTALGPLSGISGPFTEGGSTNPVAWKCLCAVLQHLQSLWGCLCCDMLLCTINGKTRPWLWVFAKQSSAKEVVFSLSGPWCWRALQFLNLSGPWLVSYSKSS